MSYDPNLLIDELMRRLNLRNDAALSGALKVNRALISSVRAQTMPIGAVLLLRAEELTGIPVPELRRMMGDRRCRLRVGAAKRSARK